MIGVERCVLKTVHRLILALFIVTSSACGLLPGKSSLPNVTDYSLNAGFAPGPQRMDEGVFDSCVSVQVMLPRAAAGYNTSRMAYTEDQNSLNYFAYSQWIDTPAYMLQPLLVKALQDSGVFRTVVKSPSPVRTRFRLISDELAVVQQINGGRNNVRIGIRLQLFDTKEGALVIDEPMVLERMTEANPQAGATTANAVARDLIQALANKVREAVRTEELCPQKVAGKAAL